MDPVTFGVIIISWLMLPVAVAGAAGAVECIAPLLVVRETVRNSYPDGLGPLSDDYGEGVTVMQNGNPLGRKLYALSTTFEELQWVAGKIFHMKVSESREVFDLVEAIEANGHKVNLTKMTMMPIEVRQKFVEFEVFLKTQLSVALIPLNNVLKKFPKDRTSVLKIPTAAVAA